MSSTTKSQAKFEHLLFQEGIAYEQTRIVELLEDPLHHNIRFPNEHINCYACRLLVFIKGEQK